MKIEIVNQPVTEVACDAIILHAFAKQEQHQYAIGSDNERLISVVRPIIEYQPDITKFGSTTVVYTLGTLKAKQIILVGGGEEEELTLDRLRSLAAIACRTAQANNAKVLAWQFDTAKFDPAATAAAIAEGAELGTYRFTYYKTTDNTPDRNIERLILIGENSRERQGAINEAQIIAAGVKLARDLVNHPAQFMTPSQMAKQAKEVARQVNLEIEILEQADIANLNMSAFLAVAKGSDEPPKLIVLKYTGNPDDPHFTAFIGKGITFDSGGISLKPSEGMQDMKDDMAGGAAVLGAMLAIGQLKPATNIWGIIPCTENMPSGHASRPGDIITAMNGKTIEIINTDAEGRLILADAITYAIRQGAIRLVDLATLTGACIVALGKVASGVMSNDQGWCQKVLMAAEQVGEKMWQLPNYPEYKELIKSDVADLKNSGGRPAGAITAGMFLAEFAEKTPWVHIDIAGTVTSEKDNGYNVKGATGVGVRTLVSLARSLAI